MIITMVRHGQTDANFNRIIQGRKDNPLNLVGRDQAKAVGKKIKEQNLQIDRIISSQLSRALETAAIIKEVLLDTKPIRICHHLIEREFGYLEEKPFEMAIPFIHTNPQNYRGYEPDETIIRRVTQSIKRLYHEYSNQHILIVAHSHVIKALLVSIDQTTYSFANHRLQNTDIYTFIMDEYGLRLKK